MKNIIRMISLAAVFALAVSMFASCDDEKSEKSDSSVDSVASSTKSVVEADELKGVWKTPEDSVDDITWDFDGSGKCTFDNTAIKQNGTYEFLEEGKVKVMLELWEKAKIYDYKIEGDTMSFIDESGLASYEVLNRQ